MRLKGLALFAIALVCSAAVATAAVAAGGDISTDQLAYKGAAVKTQIDVNGAAAVSLVGSALDALAAQIEEQAKAAKGGPPAQGPMAMLPMAAPVIGPARDAIKSLSRVTVLVLAPKGEVRGDQFVAHYSNLMGPKGWTPLVTVKDEDGTGIVTMLGPEGKGLFFGVNDKKEMVVGLITTTRPLGELIGQIVSASGGAWPAVLSAVGKGMPAPPAPPTAPEAPQAPQGE